MKDFNRFPIRDSILHQIYGSTKDQELILNFFQVLVNKISEDKIIIIIK